MNEEQAVLNFFAQEENLPLALSVAELVDATRQRMNNDFWLRLSEHLAPLATGWEVKLTEDRDAEDCLVGLYLQPHSEQSLFLRPMMEQQMIGGMPRIYFGLMWSSAPTPDKARLAEVVALRDALQHEGFKNNESFLGWQWSPYHPRSKKFLLRLSASADKLLEEAADLLQLFLRQHGAALQAANSGLREPGHTTAVSLDSLRASLKR